jgi:alpha-L-rhamnosidase
LDPAQTDYNKIALYSTYDITTSLQKNNAIGVILGNGRCVEHFGYEFPKLIVQIHIQYSDGSSEIICTDESWMISEGPILENGMYFGEKYDARLEMPGWDNPNFDDSSWDNVSIVEGYNLASQLMQPIQISKTMIPQKMESPTPEVYIYDFGQNYTGFVRLKVRGPRGCEVKLRFSEILKEDGKYFFHSNVPKVGDFFCSHELINKIHSNILWGQLSNLMSIPTDCPQRDERHGWMGDAQLSSEEAIFNFDMARFYTKYLRDIKLCQKEDGSISDVVPPYWAIYPSDPAWGTAYISLTWNIYWYYNDTRVLEENYDSLKRYIEFLSISAKDNILKVGGKYGDWCPPMSIASKRTPLDLISTWYYYHDTLLFSKIASILGREKDSVFYSEKAEVIKDAFNQEFLLRTYKYIKVSFTDQAISQTSNVLPLYLKMVPENKKKSILNNLVDAIKGHYDYHIDTGIVGTRYIFEVLTDNGYPEIAYRMITQKSFPGFGYMIREGATTLWERWEKLESGGMNSHNHIMLGSVDTWFYKTLVGIISLKAGWKYVRIKPYVPDDIANAVGSMKTIRGLISSSWEKSTESLKMNLEIPIGCIAEVWIPIKNNGATIKEGDTLIWQNGKDSKAVFDIDFKELKDDYVIFNVGSGLYEFTIRHQ